MHVALFLSFLRLNSISLCIYKTYFFIHSSLNGHLSYFPILAIVNSATRWLKRKEDSRLHPIHAEDYLQGKKNWVLGRKSKEWQAGKSTCPQCPSCLLVFGGGVFTWRRRNEIQLTEKQWLLCPALSLALPIYYLLFIPTLTLWGNRSSGRYDNQPKIPQLKSPGVRIWT